jgi:hypothetical protein
MRAAAQLYGRSSSCSMIHVFRSVDFVTSVSEYRRCVTAVNFLREIHMRSFTTVSRVALATVLLASATASAQEMPADYKAVLSALGKTGDFKDGVLKVNIPRTDLRVTIGQRPAPTPFAFGGWVALTKGEAMDVMMGDLVLTEDEVGPVMSALLQNGLDVTALHNHFFWEQPRIFYMHVHGMGTADDLAKRVKPAIDLSEAGAGLDPVVTRAVVPDTRWRRPREDHRYAGRSERPCLQDHHRPSRHQLASARSRDQRTYGLEHMGCIRRNRCRRDGGWRRGDARERTDPGAAVSARKRNKHCCHS